MLTQPLHKQFQINGLSYSQETLIELANDLITHGHQHEKLIGDFLIKWFDDSPFIAVKTSGSTGKPKTINILKNAMINSAVATGDYFNLPPGSSALLCLSAGYIAGKMMLVRAMILGWHLHIVAPEKDALTQYDNTYDFVAMVPYQVYHSIPALEKAKKILIGGGEITPQLETKLQEVKTQVYASYGMTETITHIAIRKVNGEQKNGYYEALPQVTFNKDSRGCLIIDAPLIAEDKIVTNDLVTLISPTKFVWLGRYDFIINSGGIKIIPEQVENKLNPFINQTFIIASQKDAALGERVVLVIESDNAINIDAIIEKLSVLEKYERPKKIITVSRFPRTATGKINRMEILNHINKEV
jgi:O-succinylbenzoic acid--CoA ligase